MPVEQLIRNRYSVFLPVEHFIFYYFLRKTEVKKLNKASLIRSASKTTGLSLRDTAACIDGVIEAFNEALSRGDRIELRGFGTFDVRKTAARKAAFADVPTHGRIIFKPCQKLRKSVWNKTGGHK